MLLYHINVGYPVVDAGTKLIAPIRSVTPLNDSAAKGREEYARFTAPISGYREQVFMHQMAAATDGYVTAALVNPNFNEGQGLGFFVRYRQRELPCFNEWKMMGEGTYAVALEPATNTIEGRAMARQELKLMFLEPGEERHYHLECGVLSCLSEITKLEQDLDKISVD